MCVERRSRSQPIWDTMPRPTEAILYLASEVELDEEYHIRRQQHDEMIRLHGYEIGSTMVLEEEIEFLIDRLNAYEKYADEMKRWMYKLRRKYLLIDKSRESYLDAPHSHNAEIQDILYRHEMDNHKSKA